MAYALFLDPSGFFRLPVEGAAFSDIVCSEVKIQNDTELYVNHGGVWMWLSLYGVTFERKIYEPGHIQAEIMIRTVSSLTVSNVFDMLDSRKASLSVDGVDVAQNYYIHEISPQFESKSVKKDGQTTTEYYVYVKLDIYSPDKLMTLNKYSRAYLGHRLIGDLVTLMKDDFARPGKELSIDLKPLEDSQLQQLGYKENNVMKELIQPYLVQYNESFHDFLVRVANRCGEIFYFENGSLCFGLSDKEVTDITTARRVVYKQMSENPLTVRDYARNAVQGKWKWKDEDKDSESFEVDYKLGDNKLISEPIDNEKDGFPLDAFPRPEKSKAGSDFRHYYNSEIASEDYYLLLYRDKFARDDFPDIWWGKTDVHLMEWLSDLLNSTSLMELVSNFGSKSILLAEQCATRVGKENQKGNELLESQALNTSNDYAVLYSKVDNLEKHWVTLDYYHDIRQKGEEQMRKAVCVDMGATFVDVGLGDKITLPHSGGETYVVVKVEMTSGVMWQRDYENLISNPQKVGLFATQPLPRSQVIYAIPMYKKDGKKNSDSEVFYPPVLPGKPFRQCGPQPAFVVDNKDPKAQGRVRIRYPWQASLKESDAKVSTAESNLSTAGTTLFQSFSAMWEKATVSLKKGDTPITLPEGIAALAVDAKNYAFTYVVDKEVTVTFTPKEGHSETETEYINALAKFKEDRETVFDYLQALAIANTERMIDESATPWIRMATPMATPGGGMFFRPEKGDEVMVDFENGNVERPYVVGLLYSKNVTVPDNAGSRAIVSRNGHMIKMDDPSDAAKFAEGCYPGFKYLSKFGVGLPGLEGHSNKILGGIEMTDQLGFYNIKISSHDRNITISSPFGDVKMNAFTGISINAPNGDIKISGKNVDISAFNKLSITSGKNIKQATDSDTRNGYVGSFASGSEWGKTTVNFLSTITGVGNFLDLSLLRYLVEIFLRPIDGTFAVKSYRFLTLEAGGGKSSAQPNEYDFRLSDLGTKKFSGKLLPELIRYVLGKIDKYVTDYLSSYNAVVDSVSKISSLSLYPAPSAAGPVPAKIDPNRTQLLVDMFAQPEWTDEAALDTEFDKYYKNDNSGTLKISAWVTDPDKNEIEGWAKNLMRNSMKLRKNAADIERLFEDANVDARFRGFISNDDAKAILMLAQVLPAAGGAELSPNIDLVLKCTSNSNVDPQLFTAELQANTFREWKKYVERRLLHKIIENCRADSKILKGCTIPAAEYGSIQTMTANGFLSSGAAPGDKDNPFLNDTDWARYISAIRLVENEDEQRNSFLQGVIDSGLGLVDKLIPWELKAWTAEAKGKILFSDEKNKTYRFNNGATEHYANPVRSLVEDEKELKALLGRL